MKPTKEKFKPNIPAALQERFFFERFFRDAWAKRFNVKDGPRLQNLDDYIWARFRKAEERYGKTLRKIWAIQDGKTMPTGDLPKKANLSFRMDDLLDHAGIHEQKIILRLCQHILAGKKFKSGPQKQTAMWMANELRKLENP